MKDLKKSDLKKDVYEEEIIRIEYIAGSDYKVKEREVLRLLAELGYKWCKEPLYSLNPTLFKTKELSLAEDYLNSGDNKFSRVMVSENENQQVILTKYATIIRTKSKSKHLENVRPILKFIDNHLIHPDTTTLKAVRFEASTIDYITDIQDVERYYKGILVDTQLVEEYNVKRDPEKEYYHKSVNYEGYSSRFASSYFIENGICYDKEVNFATAEYYDERVAHVKINIGVSYQTRNSKLSKYNFRDVIAELEEEQFKMFLNAHKDEYIETLI